MNCPESDCDGELVERQGRFGKFYGCSNFKTTRCKGSAQHDKKTNKPANVADSATKNARKRAREIFNKMIESGEMTKDEASQWLADVMMKDKSRASIASLSLDECQRLIRVMEATSGNG